MTAFSELDAQYTSLIWVYAIVFLRLGPVVSLFPALGEHSVPARLKLGITLAICLVITPAVRHAIPAETASGSGFVWLCITETIIGLMMGMGVRLFVLALQTAGSMAAQATSLSQIFGTAGPDPMPAMGYILVLGGATLAMMAMLHVKLATLIILTYDLFPPGHLPAAGDAAHWGMRQVAATFGLALTLASPFLIVSVLYNLTLGIINRAMPQMMVA